MADLGIIKGSSRAMIDCGGGIDPRAVKSTMHAHQVLEVRQYGDRSGAKNSK